MIKGPIDIPQKSNGPNLKISHDDDERSTPGISSGPLIVNSLDTSLAGKTRDKNPTTKESVNRRQRERHQIRGGKKLQNVIKRRTIAIKTLQIEPARIGLNKNKRIQESLIRGSITRSQLESPATY